MMLKPFTKRLFLHKMVKHGGVETLREKFIDINPIRMVRSIGTGEKILSVDYKFLTISVRDFKAWIIVSRGNKMIFGDKNFGIECVLDTHAADPSTYRFEFKRIDLNSFVSGLMD
jgi:hypothetical protein